MAIKDVTDEALGNAKKSYRGNEAMEVLIENNRIIVYTGRDALLKRNNAEPDVWDATDFITKNLAGISGVSIEIIDNMIKIGNTDRTNEILNYASNITKGALAKVENNKIIVRKVK